MIPTKTILHMLTNPFSFKPDEMKQARVSACHLIEDQERIIKKLKREKSRLEKIKARQESLFEEKIPIGKKPYMFFFKPDEMKALIEELVLNSYLKEEPLIDLAVSLAKDGRADANIKVILKQTAKLWRKR